MIAAFVLIQVAPSTDLNVREVHTALHAVPGVKTVHFVMGPTDAIAFVEVADLPALTETIGKMHAVKGVGHTDSRLVLPI